MGLPNKLMHVFLDVHMGKSHVGLTKIARKESVDPFALKPGQHLVFVNRKGDKMKIFSANNVIAYKMDKHRLDLGALQHFAECFGADGFEYTKALEKTLRERLTMREQPR